MPSKPATAVRTAAGVPAGAFAAVAGIQVRASGCGCSTSGEAVRPPDLVVGEIREAQDESGIGERVGGDGEGAVGGDLGEDGAGRAIGETVEAGGDATVDSGTAAAELDRHGAVEIRPIDRTRGDAGAGIPVGPIAGEFHVVVDRPAVAELVFPLGADVALA